GFLPISRGKISGRPPRIPKAPTTRGTIPIPKTARIEAQWKPCDPLAESSPCRAPSTRPCGRRCRMKISHIICQILRVESVQKKTASCQDVVLVRVRTDTGLEGIGEADASPEVIKAIIDAPFSHNIACGLRE